MLRQLICLGFATLLSSAGAARAADRSSQEQVAMFRGGLAHTGAYAGEGLADFQGVRWKFKTKGRIFGSPAIHAGTVYVGGDDRRFYALDARTGTEKWHFETKGGGINSSPAVSDEGVFFMSADGSFYALDPASGKQLWKFQTGGERRFEAHGLHGVTPHNQTIPDSWDLFLSSPALYAGAVYFGCGDGNVYALDAKTGQLKWKAHTGDVVHASPAIVDGTVYIGSWDSYLYALDAATGKELWKFKTGEDHEISNQVGIQSSAAVADGVVYFGCRDSHLYAVDAKTGREKWNFSAKGSWVISSPAVRDGIVYFGTSDSQLFRAHDAQTGERRFELPASMYVFSSPAIAGQMAYVGTWDGRLYAIDLKVGRKRWEFQTEASKVNLPSLLGPDGKPDPGKVFASDFWEEMVLAVHKLFTLGSILSSPVVDGDTIYLGSADGYLYALAIEQAK